MWVEAKKAPSLMLAEMWKDLFEGEGVPARIMGEKGLPSGQEIDSYRVMVPEDKKHIIDEVLRKL